MTGALRRACDVPGPGNMLGDILSGLMGALAIGLQTPQVGALFLVASISGVGVGAMQRVLGSTGSTSP